jgi:basic amino acid/polyamine antiporter, APA family
VSAAETPDASSTTRGEPLLRVIGTFGLAAAIINITVGGGIFRLPANVAGSLGAAAPIAYIVCAVAMGLIVFCIADAGRRVPVTGGPYAYIGTAFGPFIGFMAGVLLWMLGTFATAAVGTVFASSVGLLVPVLAGRYREIAVLIAAFGFWSLVNLRGAALAVRLNSIVTVAKLLPLLMVGVVGVFFVDNRNLQIASIPAAGDVARTSLLLIFAFAGIECALVPSGEVRDVARTVPRAIALAMIGITTLYVVLQVVAQGILGSALAASRVAPLADAAGVSLGGWGRSLLLVGATVSTFGNLGGVTLSMPRIVFALARDGFLPGALSAVHPVHRVPHAAILAQTLITLALAVSGTFEKLAILANVSALALYLGCALASWRLSGIEAIHRAGPPRRSLSGVVPWLATGVIMWLLSGMTGDEWIGFGICLIAAALIYLVTRRPVTVRT